MSLIEYRFLDKCIRINIRKPGERYFKRIKGLENRYPPLSTRTKIRKLLFIRYEECVVDWQTDLTVDDGQEIEPTKQNFIELFMFDHPDMRDNLDAFLSTNFYDA